MVMISPLIHSHSSYNVHNDHLNRTLERALDEAVRTGELILSARKLHEFSNVNETCDLSDTTHADLSRNHLTEFPLILCSFYSLERLNLYHNAIKSIPEQINKIYLVKIIDLSRNQLTSIPSALCELPFLEVLILNNNKILSLPEEIGQTERLIELDVSTNELKRLPSQIGRLSSLRILNVRRNQLVELPFELCQLKLTHFDCSFNRLTCLPLNLREMISLIDLNVEQNPLKCPPSSICSLGILHIMRYLLVEAIKGEKQRGVLTEHEINTKYRNSFSYQGSRRSKCDRKVVVQSDSGYLTTENSEKADDSIVSMSNDQPISGDPTFMLSLADEFSKELARQKAEYERKKVQAQHLKRHLLQRLGESESQRMKTREIARRMHDEKFEKIEKQRQDARRKLENSKNLQIFHYSPKIDEKKRPTHRAASVEMKMPREMKEKNGVDFGFRCDRHRRISVEENSSLTRRNLLQAKEENLLVEQMRKMIENRLKVTLSDDLCSAFNDGVVLCHFINQIRAGSVQTIHVPSPAVPKVSLAKCRRNVENFLQASSRLGVPQSCLAKLNDIILPADICNAKTNQQLAFYRLFLTLHYLDYVSFHQTSISMFDSHSTMDKIIANFLLVFLALFIACFIYYHSIY